MPPGRTTSIEHRTERTISDGIKSESRIIGVSSPVSVQCLFVPLPANSDELGCGQKKRNKTVKIIPFSSRVFILSAGEGWSGYSFEGTSLSTRRCDQATQLIRLTVGTAYGRM